MKRIVAPLSLALLTLLACVATLFAPIFPPALAQDTPEEERSYLVRLLEDQLSTPNRQIRISGIQGVLSSDAVIGQISIADREGVWLRIVNARIVWTRSALLLGRLSINTLAAERIEVSRKPLPEEGLPAPEATPFQLPELPVSITLGQLTVPSVTFGETVFGLASELSINGGLELADGSLETQMAITRVDGPGGDLALKAAYANSSRVLDLDLSLNEPADGLVANLLAIEGKPPVTLALKGAGPLDSLDLSLTLDAAAQRILTGATALRQGPDGLTFDTTLDGPIAQLVPEQFRSFFGAETTLAVNGAVKDGGGVRIEAIDLKSAALALTGSAETTADNFLQSLRLDATLDNGGAEKIVLPVPGGDTTVESAALSVAFGEASGENWTGVVNVDGLSAAMFSAETVKLDLGGVAQNLGLPAERRVTFKVDGGVDGIVATRAEVAEALGRQLTLAIEGAWDAGTPVRLARALLTGNGLGVSLSGDIDDYIFTGDIGIDAASLSPFSQLAGRDLSGAIALKATGTVKPISGGFDLTLDSVANELRIGTQAADNLLAGETRITGRVARGETGLIADRLRIANQQLALNANGTYATGAADFGFDLDLTSLTLLSEEASGRLTAQGRAVGSDGLIGLNLGANVASGALAGKTLNDAVIAFEGTLQDNNLNGTIAGNAFLDRVAISLSSAIAVLERERRLQNLDFSAGGARLTGGVIQNEAGLLTGDLKLAAPNISTAAALFLQEATGAVDADINLSIDDGRQNAGIKATIDNLAMDAATLGNARLEATIADLFNVPMANGSLEATNLKAGGIVLTQLSAKADQSGETTNFSADARLDNGTVASAAGALTPVEGGYRVTLDKTDLRQGQLAASLVEPSTVEIKGQTISIGGVLIDIGGGQISARGTVADRIDLAIGIQALPLAIANTIRPDLGLGGTIDGEATVSGSRSQPDVAFNIRGRTLTAAALRQAGLSSLGVDATGTTNANRVNVEATISSPEGLRTTVNGAVPLGDGALALDIDLAAFPLAILNTVAPGQNLGGALSGKARVTGALADPSASFDLAVPNLTAAPLASAGAAPLSVAASGSYANQTVTLASATANGPQGLTVSANGSVPLSGPGLGVTISGEVPLALANRFLADRGARADGTISLSASVSGSIAQPLVRGMVSTAGATLVDPESNLQLRNIAAFVSLDGETATIRNASADLASGGSISASGSVSTNAAAAFPADIRISLDNARYADGNLVVATVNGALAVTGSLARDPLISGDINVVRAEITVPETFAGGAAALDVKHIRPPAAVAETLARARANDGTPTPSGRPSIVRLDINVNAPNRIFVRGRGLDAELGGSVRLTGPVTDIQPVGGFQLVRGRLSILSQRITFDEGTVTLVGDLDPFINLVARSSGSDITVFVTVSGRVSDIDIAFSSQPTLPQDEVLARLIFNRGIGELSPLQIAQLAAAAAELAGGPNNSLLGNLRKATGLDDLDVVTDSEGNAALKAGRYIQENIYLGVEAGAGGTTRGTINLDITPALKARGSAGTDGGSVGVFFEKDY